MTNKNQPWDVVRFKGTGSWNGITHESNTAVVNSGFRQGVPTVRFQTAANHNLTAGSAITLAGSTNYDKTFKTLAGTATDKIYVPARYVDETLTTTDTFKITLALGIPFEFGGFKLHFGSGAASAALTINLDAGAGSVYDTNIYTLAATDISGETDVILDWTNEPMPFPHKDDELDFAYANTQTFGLEVFWRRLS